MERKVTVKIDDFATHYTKSTIASFVNSEQYKHLVMAVEVLTGNCHYYVEFEQAVWPSRVTRTFARLTDAIDFYNSL